MALNTSITDSQLLSNDNKLTSTEELGIAIFVCMVLFLPGLLVCKMYYKWRIQKKEKKQLSAFDTEKFAFKWKRKAFGNQITWGLVEKHGLDSMTVIRRLAKSEISINDVKLDKLLKIGQTVRVFEAILKKKGTIQNVAAKMLQEDFTKEDFRLMNAKIQFFTTKKLKHPNVVKFIGAIRHNDTYGPIMILELCSGPTVREWLEDFRMQVNDDTLSQIKKFALDIGQGMVYLAEQKIIHKRLASRNVLLNVKLEAKIGCFGPRHKDKILHPFQRERMPIQWFAPESLVELNTYSTESDVWSYGVTLWEIFSVGDLPYINYNNTEIIDLLKDGYRLMKPQYADDRFYGLMKSCWKMKPEMRPTFPSIVRELHSIIDVHSESD